MRTIITNDVEDVSITNNNLSFETAKKVADVGLPRTLSLYSRYNVKGTFYFTGRFAEQFPNSVIDVAKKGHEVGCHGYIHEPKYSFDRISPKQQFLHLYKSKSLIEELIGPIEAFRAPALRLGDYTISILEKLGFRTDSSVASQRFDGPFSFGSIRKLSWLSAPRNPYFPSYKCLYRQGNSKILEIPTSAMLFAFQGTTMRVAPKINELIGSFLFNESRLTKKPIVFLYHPNEAITEKQNKKIPRRSKSFLGYLFGDYLRRKLKLRNLGKKSIKLHEEILKASIKNDFEFVTAKEFRQSYI